MELRASAQSSHNYNEQFICRIVFDSESLGDAAYKDVRTYGKDLGYGDPYDFIRNPTNESWDVWLDCSDLPLVIRMANNQKGRITWWNDRFLDRPDMDIPYFIPTKPKEEKEGCYIATCVYGSYDCPEVWTLRRYRDLTLDKTWYGRWFIRTYYSFSPVLVRWFGETLWFKEFFHTILDSFISKLKSRGFKDTPYVDKY